MSDTNYLKELQGHWHQFGKINPMWAVLTEDDMTTRQWDHKAFFELGREEIAKIFDHIAEIPFEVPRGAALDFGCGAGRLTQALAQRFESCVGVDIAPSMIQLATRLNREGKKCQFYLNERNDLSAFADQSFDFVYTNLVLQHIRPEYSQTYIREFMRLIRPKGMVVFQLPSQPIAYALPDSGFQAELHADLRPLMVKPGKMLSIVVAIKNTGTAVWSRSNMVRLGAFWLNLDGSLVSAPSERCDFSVDLHPSQEVELVFKIVAPLDEEMYLLELGLVQDGIAWFRDKGVPPLKITVTVEENRLIRFLRNHPWVQRWQAKPVEPEPEPVMETHGVLREEVEALIAECGGNLLFCQTEQSVPGWEGFRYYVSK